VKTPIDSRSDQGKKFREKNISINLLKKEKKKGYLVPPKKKEKEKRIPSHILKSISLYYTRGSNILGGSRGKEKTS